MVEVELNKILISEKSFEQMIVLKEKDGTRTLPIIIGIFEAMAINRKIHEEHTPRPLTHDLMINVIKKLNGELKYVVVSDLSKGTYYAKLIIQKENKEEIVVDSRPSDAIALAVRVGCPIYVEEKVFELSQNIN